MIKVTDFTLIENNVSFNSVLKYFTVAPAVAAGGAITAGLAGAGGLAGAAGGAVAGGVSSAANFALNQAANTIKNMSIVIVILGLFQFYFRFQLGDTHPLIYALSIILFILAGYSLSEKVQVEKLTVFVPMIIFCVWYFYFKANYMPMFLIYFLSISALILISIDLFTKNKSLQPEMYGFIPVIFFFLDIGFIPFLVDTINLPITDLTKSLILFMPWWAFFGIMTFPIDGGSDSKMTAIMRIMHILGIIYIIIVFLIPLVPAIGYDQASLVPSVSTFSENQQQYREKLSGEINPIVIWYQCSREGRLQELNECQEEKKAEAEIRNICKAKLNEKGLAEEIYENELDRCVKETKERQKNWEQSASGIISSDLDKPILIEIEKGSSFDNDITIFADRIDSLSYPIIVNVENPLKKSFEFKPSCIFENKNKRKASVNGTVYHHEIQDGKITNTKSDRYEVSCKPNGGEVLNGSYQLKFDLFLPSMVSSSYMKRVIVKEYDPKNKLKNPEQEAKISSFFQGDGRNGEAFYPREFVGLNFGISEEKVLELDDKPLLSSFIKNIGEGRIGEVLWYEIQLDHFEIEGDSESCYLGDSSSVYIKPDNNNRYIEFLGSCTLNYGQTIKDEVESFGISHQTITAEIGYSYYLEASYKVEIDLK